tara:strand:- start:2522 stop:2752 length:231 start_codon:yes stop_codon:yes gene_type:complete
MLVTVQAANFIEDKHKLCYINKKNAEYIQKIMKDKHNAEFRMLEIELVDTINFKMKTNININDDEYEWGSLCSQVT